MTVGVYPFHFGAGPFGAIVVGFFTAGFRFLVGQYIFSARALSDCSPFIGLLFAVPAACAGYSVALELAHLGMSLGMVAGVVRLGWGHRCRKYRLGACVDADRPRSWTGRCSSPIQPPNGATTTGG